MKNALIINGGLNSTKRDQLDNYDFIVAVDSGAEHAYKLFLKPDLFLHIPPTIVSSFLQVTPSLIFVFFSFILKKNMRLIKMKQTLNLH